MTSGAQPLVSVLVTCFNHERYVEQALDSLAAQTYGALQLSIVDDCSTDGSVSRIEAWLERSDVDAQLVVNPRNLGVCATRNVGLAHCRGEYVASLSADDWYEPDKVERQVEFFATLGDDVSSVYGNMRLVDESGNDAGRFYPDVFPDDMRAEGRIFDRLIRKNFLPAPTVMTRRAAYDVVGGYDESLTYDDEDMWLRLSNRFGFAYLPGVVVNWRVLESSLSRDPARLVEQRESGARLLAKWFGASAELDQVIADRIWTRGIQAFLVDARRGRAILSDPRLVRARPRRRWLVRMTRVPGARHVARGLVWMQTTARELRRGVTHRLH
jgi:glycosyltransferase involved in cell wall biosynthesis